MLRTIVTSILLFLCLLSAASGQLMDVRTQITGFGVLSKTSAYTILRADGFHLISVSNSGATTITLPATAPPAGWQVEIENTGAGTWTVSRNGLNIDGGTTNPTLVTNQGILVWSDGSNYFTLRGGAQNFSSLSGTLGCSQLPTFTGDVSNSSCAMTVVQVEGGSIPASGAVLGTNSSKQLIAATAHGIITPFACSDSSGSGTAQSCSTIASFTPASGDTILYSTTTANTGDVTINVNALGAKHVRKWLGSSVLASGDLPANTPVLLTYDGTYWEDYTIGNAPSSSPTGSAGGDLSGTYPNPTVAKINGGSVPSGAAAHQVLVATAANTYSLKTIPDCQDTSGNHLNYTQSSDTLSCGTTSGSSGGAVVQVHFTNDATGATNNRIVHNSSATTVADFPTTGGVSKTYLGIVNSGGGTSGTSTITVLGTQACDFDGATTAKDYVIPSTTTAGKCHDNGSTSPNCSSNKFTIGTVQSTNGAAGTYNVDMFPYFCQTGGTGSGGIPIIGQAGGQWSASSLAQDAMTLGGNLYLLNSAQFVLSNATTPGSGDQGSIRINTTTSGPEIRSAGGGGGPIYLLPGVSVGVETNAGRSGSFSLPTGNGGIKEYTLTGNITISGYDSHVIAGTVWWLDLCEDATGGRTVTWPANLKNTPTIDTTANKCNVGQIVYVSSSKQVALNWSSY